MSGPLTTLCIGPRYPTLHIFLTLIEFINSLDVYLSRFQSTVCWFAESDQGHARYADKQISDVLSLVHKRISSQKFNMAFFMSIKLQVTIWIRYIPFYDTKERLKLKLQKNFEEKYAKLNTVFIWVLETPLSATSVVRFSSDKTQHVH